MAPRSNKSASTVSPADLFAAYLVSQKGPLPTTRNELKATFLDLRAHPIWQSLGISWSPANARWKMSNAGFLVVRHERVIWTKLFKEKKNELAGMFDFGKTEDAEGEVGLRRELRALGYQALTGHTDIQISWPFPPDRARNRLQSLDVDATGIEHIDIINTSQKSQLLLGVFTPIMRPQGAFFIVGSPAMEGQEVVNIAPGQRLRLTMTLSPQMLGLHQAAVMFAFAGFELVRSVQVLVEDAVTRASAPKSPYVKLVKKSVTNQVAEILKGEAPSMPVTKYQNRLPEFKIPAAVRNAVINGGELPILREGLSAANYQRKMAALLHVEELQMEVDIQQFKMEGADLERSEGRYLALTVPGLAEKRPSVLYGDRVFVHFPEQPQWEYEGYVHRVRQEEVLLKFHPSFHGAFVQGRKVNVRFTFNRVTIRREHEAITESATLPRGILFPATSDWVRVNPSSNPSQFRPLNKELNQQQLGAVQEILNKSGGGVANDCPYLVFGPPGTGKTNTCIEAMLQILRKDPSSRILACTPSNFAADVILERLQGHVQKRELYRLNAPARSETEAEHIMDYCTFDPALGHFTIPTESALAKYRVIVSTCCSASLLHAQGLPRGHFSHVFIDEAGHAKETEAIIPVALFATQKSVVVLAGDHKQLGPIVRSRLATRSGLEKSYLERLAMGAPYLPQGPNREYHPSFITRLVRNYRSHPAILELPSEMFYGGQLISCANEALRSSLTKWEVLPNRNEFPILFHGVEGKDEREGNSPSWFNPTEVSQVVKYVGQLRALRRTTVQACDIGVISPYRKQVQKIGKQLQAKYPGVRVGSVEQFQGREKRVIIISTVRSSAEHIESDLKHNLGFLRNPKRFNVATTRAKALLIIIGNPHVLAQDRCWGQLYEYCYKNGAYVGCEGPKPPGAQNAEEALLAEWSHLNLSDGASDDGVEVERPEWPEAK